MKRTQRGFAIYSEFTDVGGSRVRIQQSSLATKHAVWVFCDGPSDGDMVVGSAKPFKSAPHLTVAQARRVVKALQAFIDAE